MTTQIIYKQTGSIGPFAVGDLYIDGKRKLTGVSNGEATRYAVRMCLPTAIYQEQWIGRPLTDPVTVGRLKEIFTELYGSFGAACSSYQKNFAPLWESARND